MSKDTTPYAFPQWDGHAITSEPQYLRGGMTLREYFAGQVLAGLASNSSLWDEMAGSNKVGHEIYAGVAKIAVAQADALIAELSKP